MSETQFRECDCAWVEVLTQTHTTDRIVHVGDSVQRVHLCIINSWVFSCATTEAKNKY